MYAISILSSLNRSFSTKIRAAVSSLQHIRRSSYKVKVKNVTSYDIKSQVKEDVVLFRIDQTKFFVAVNIFSALQCAFWTYLGVFLSQSLKNSTFTLKGQKVLGKVLEKEREYGTILGVICIIFGWSIFALTISYSFRSARKIILHKGGNSITVITHGLPGWNTVKMPISHVSSLEHRVRAKKYIPVKLKNKFLYYLVDVNGEFSNPNLFDFTVGVKRAF